MRSLLFLAQRLPYPPTKGDKIRSFAVLRHLAQSWRIHLGCFVDDPLDLAHVPEMARFCVDSRCVPLDSRWAKARSLAGLVRGTSLSEAYFNDRRLAGWVRRTLERVRPQAAFLYSSVMAQYIPDGELRPPTVVMDYIDVDSDKWRQYAKTTPWPANLIYRREARRLLAFDTATAARIDAGLFVSAAEAELFRRLTGLADNIHPIPNGVDHAFFAPDPALPRPFGPGVRPLVFTGAMDYRPNIDAVRWFADEILPSLLAKLANARLFIVGSNPTPEVTRLAQRPGITVTGRVADVRPYLAHAEVAVAPLRLARGIQNKVLEAMAMARPVVTTPQGWEGIDAQPGHDLLVADGARDFLAATLRVLNDPALAARLASNARARILEGYGWADKLAEVDRLLG